MGELDTGTRTVVYCQSGIRSAVAASWMRTQGFDDIADVVGGYAAWDSLVGA